MLFVHSVSWLIWFGCHYQCKLLIGKALSAMTYNVLMRTLNASHSLSHLLTHKVTQFGMVTIFREGSLSWRPATPSFSRKRVSASEYF